MKYQVVMIYESICGATSRVLTEDIPTKKLADQLALDFKRAMESSDTFYAEPINQFNRRLS